MSAKRRFYTVSGEVIAERAAGGSRVAYFPDALGSVTMASDGVTDSSATYTPYGRGSAPSGATLGWVGSQGYRPTGRTYASHSVRRRIYDDTTGAWTTVDPLWPHLPAYEYVADQPTLYADPSGLQVVFPLLGEAAEEILPRTLPPGWEIITSSGGAPIGYPFWPVIQLPPGIQGPPAPIPIPNLPPVPFPTLPFDECELGESPSEDQCRELGRFYHRFCPGRKEHNPKYSQCRQNDPPELLKIKMLLWCACCLGREAYDRSNCPKTHSPGDDSTRGACKNCKKCINLLWKQKGLPPGFQGPPEPPIMPGPKPIYPDVLPPNFPFPAPLPSPAPVLVPLFGPSPLPS